VRGGRRPWPPLADRPRPVPALAQVIFTVGAVVAIAYFSISSVTISNMALLQEIADLET
jgi:hypothetical protein